MTELFFGAIDRHGDRRVVMRFRRDGTWHAIRAGELLDRVRCLAIGLRELGVRPGDRVGLLSENRPEWALTDFACLALRCADVPVYPNLPAGHVEYMLRDSGATAVCLSSRHQLEKIREIRCRLPALRQVIVFDDGLEGDDVVPLSAVLAMGRAAGDRHRGWREDALAATPQDLATIIYTSGTTGDPKGVMLTHGNIASNVVAALSVLGVCEADECLSCLPLSHIFERMAGHYVMFHAGVTINYARGLDTVAADLVDARPTVVLSVPRLFEKFYAGALDAVGRSPAKQRIFRWATTVADTWSDRTLSGRPVPIGLALQQRVADALVFRKLRAAAGGRLRFFVSGGAPLPPALARFFHAAGMPILEGYGLTETSPVIAVNGLSTIRIGSVGRAVPGTEVRIAPDGEILARGPGIMAGYFNRPDATAEALDPEGWFHTGDIGRLDQDGFLHITDRKKDLIVTAGGKNIAPQPIENRLRENPFIAHAVMLGDRRKYPIVLLVPDFAQLTAWAATEGIAEGDAAALAKRPEVQAKLEAEARKHLRDLAQYEVPKRFLILSRDFSIERGEMTPKLSIRRKVVEQNFREEIAALYDEPEELERITERISG